MVPQLGRQFLEHLWRLLLCLSPPWHGLSRRLSARTWTYHSAAAITCGGGPRAELVGSCWAGLLSCILPRCRSRCCQLHRGRVATGTAVERLRSEQAVFACVFASSRRSVYMIPIRMHNSTSPVKSILRRACFARGFRGSILFICPGAPGHHLHRPEPGPDFGTRPGSGTPCARSAPPGPVRTRSGRPRPGRAGLY
jgi:hypothetical protein